jgi:hypothetical protein
MKPTIICIALLLFAQYPSSGQPKTGAYPIEVAKSAESFFGTLRSNIVTEIAQRTRKKTLSSKDLDPILGVLDGATSKVREAGYDEKLTRAAAQVETVRTQIVAAASDPGNKEALALETEAQEWLREIRLQASSGIILQTNILHLRSTVKELKKCAGILEPVAPPAQLTDRLRRRLSEMLIEWERAFVPAKETNPQAAAGNAQNLRDQAEAPPLAHEATVAASAPTGADQVRCTVWVPYADRENTPHPTTFFITSGAAAVIRMTQAQVQERDTLEFIAASRAPFRLTADHILYLRRKGVSNKLITAMLQRDTALRAAPAARIWPW